MLLRIVVLIFFALALSCASTVYADTFGSGANQFDIAFVPIGNPGNVADTTGTPNPVGSVGYSYRMGKYEISEDMINKANAQSAIDGNPLDINTVADLPGVDKPAVNITWYNAAEFVNWLNTSTGHTSAYKFDDSGNFLLWTAGDEGYNSANPFRNSHAYYFLPSDDEWYKAAYYDPNVGVYYDYPTGSDSVPDGIDFPGDTEFDAVFYDGGNNVYPNDITDVGVLSPYGTAGQGGNVWEWEESPYSVSIPESRGVRGGNWDLKTYFMQASNRGIIGFPGGHVGFIGFRVASRAIPEPSTLMLLCIGALGFAALRRWPRARQVGGNAAQS